MVALRRMSDPGIATFLADQDEFIVTEAARGINDDLSIPEALPALGKVLQTTRFTNEPLIRRAINANLRVGTPEAMQTLIDYAQKEGGSGGHAGRSHGRAQHLGQTVGAGPGRWPLPGCDRTRSGGW